MKHRQTALPRRWLIANRQWGEAFWPAVAALPPGSAILILPDVSRAQRLEIQRYARLRGLVVADEAARVHNSRELRKALSARTPIILLSPIFPTRSHPEWAAIPRMRAAALARLANRRVLALGGMNERRFRRVQRLGFVAWAGIDAFRT